MSVQSLPVSSNIVLMGCAVLKIVYPICCGMDVHKAFVVACIASTDQQGVTSYKSKRFSTYTGKLRRCAVWPAENNCKDVCMESTGNLFTTFWKLSAGLSSLTRSTSKRFAARKQAKRMLNGLLTSSSMIWSPAALFLPLTFVSFEAWCVSVGN